MSDSRTAEELGKIEAEKIYPVVTTHNWHAKENAAYRNGFEAGYANASQQTASLREENERLEQENIGLKYKITLYEGADDEWSKIVRRKKDNIKQLQEEVERVKELCSNQVGGFVSVKEVLEALSSKESKPS